LSGIQSQKIGKPNNASIVYQSTMHLNYLHLKKKCLLICENHMHDRNSSLRAGGGVGISILPLFLRLYFGIGLKVWLLLFFVLFKLYCDRRNRHKLFTKSTRECKHWYNNQIYCLI